jgi:hypothetical protein
MAIRTISAAGGNWNSTATWVGGVVPTSSDSVLGDATSGQLTMNVAATCQFVDFSAYTQTITMNAALTLGLAAATSIFGSSMSFAGTSALICNVNHTFTQNTTNTIPLLQFGSGTKTLSTDMYCNNFTCNGSTAILNGSNLNIFGNATFTGGRFNGTSEYILRGTGTYTSPTAANALGKLTIDTTGTTTTNGLISMGVGSTFKYIRGTVNFTAANFGNRAISVNTTNAATTSLILNTGQTFNYYFNDNDAGYLSNRINFQSFSGTSVDLNNLVLVGYAGNSLFHYFTTTIGTSVNIASLFVIDNSIDSLNISKLRLQAGRTFNIGNMMAFTDPFSVSGFTFPNVESYVIESDTPSSSSFLNLTDGTKTQLGYINFTDIDASGGNPIRTLDGILTRTSNITSISSVISGGGGQTAYTFAS